jgi:hypothetical protein
MALTEIDSVEQYRSLKELLIYKRESGEEQIHAAVRQLSVEAGSLTVLSPIPLVLGLGITFLIAEKGSEDRVEVTNLTEGPTLRVRGEGKNFGYIFRCSI